MTFRQHVMNLGLVVFALVGAACGGTRTDSTPDLAIDAVTDMAAATDAAVPTSGSLDFSIAIVDMAPPPDMTKCGGFGEACGCCDQAKAAAAGFYGLWCDPSSHTCQGCGTHPGDHCCDLPETQGLGRCAHDPSGYLLSCRSNTCYSCGNLNQNTCSMAPACNPPWMAMHGQCM